MKTKPVPAQSAPRCNCHEHEKQVCDICQGTTGEEKDAQSAPTPELEPCYICKTPIEFEQGAKVSKCRHYIRFEESRPAIPPASAPGSEAKPEDAKCLCGHQRWLHERRATPSEYEDCRAKGCGCTHYMAPASQPQQDAPPMSAYMRRKSKSDAQIIVELEAALTLAREALEAIIRRVALVSPYYEMARAALAATKEP